MAFPQSEPSCYWRAPSRGMTKDPELPKAPPAASGPPDIPQSRVSHCWVVPIWWGILLLLCLLAPFSLSTYNNLCPFISTSRLFLGQAGCCMLSFFLLAPPAAVSRARLGCLPTNINGMLMVHLKAVVISVCIWLDMGFSPFPQRFPGQSDPNLWAVPLSHWYLDPTELATPVSHLGSLCFIDSSHTFCMRITAFGLSLRKKKSSWNNLLLIN